MFKLKPNHIGLTLHTYLVDYSRNKKKTKQPSLLASSNIQVLWIFEVSFSLYYMELNIGLVGIHNRLNIRQSLYTYVLCSVPSHRAVQWCCPYITGNTPMPMAVCLVPLCSLQCCWLARGLKTMGLNNFCSSIFILFLHLKMSHQFL